MATNHVQQGAVMPWTNGTGSDVSAGDVVRVGSFVGVATVDIADGGAGQVAIEEVWSLPKNTSLAIAQGDRVYWDVADGELNKTATDNIDAGIAFAAAGASDTTVQVKLGA